MPNEPIFLKVGFRNDLVARFRKSGDTQIDMIKNLQEFVEQFLTANPGFAEDDDFLYFIDKHSNLNLRRRLGINAEGDKYPILPHLLKVMCAVFRKKKEHITTSSFTPLKEIRKSQEVKFVNKAFSEMASKHSPSDLPASVTSKSYQDLIDDALNPNLPTHKYEDVMIQLIEKFSNPNISDVTIVAQDLSFAFKLAPTLLSFASRPEARICLLFAPASDHSFAMGKEFLFFYNMGITIRVLPFSKDFMYEGFYFNYYPTGFNWKPSGIELYHLRNRTFDRSSLMEIYEDISPRDGEEIERALKDIKDKWQFTKDVEPIRAFGLTKLKPSIYESWLGKRFAEAPTGAKLKSVYTAALKGPDEMRFKFKTLDLDQIYFRKKYLPAYRIYQAKMSMINNPLFVREDGDTLEFTPVSVFQSGEGEYYTANVPIIEYNEGEKRYEIGDGASRLYAIAQEKKFKKIRTIVATLPASSFRIRNEFSKRSDTYISNDWSRLEVVQDHPGRDSIMEYMRRVDSKITQPYPESQEKELRRFAKENLGPPPKVIKERK